VHAEGAIKVISKPTKYQDLDNAFSCSFLICNNKLQVLSIIDSNCHNMDTKETGFLGSREPKDDQKQEIELNLTEVIRIHLPFIGISLISSSPQVNRVLRLMLNPTKKFSAQHLFYYTSFSLTGIVVCFCQGYENCCHAELRSAAIHS
jgi:hypothetical protein